MKFPLWATLLTLTGSIVLVGLGIWQLERLEWKTNILVQLEAEYAQDPMDFELTAENIAAINQREFVRGFIEGIYRHEDEILVGPRTYEGQPGYHVITPFETLDNRVVIVNRGWIPLDLKDGQYPRPRDPQIITGTLRPPPVPGPFTPENEPAADQWYTAMPQEIAAAQNLQDVAPYLFYSDQDGKLPVSAGRWQIRNNHLSYALFWFSLAAILWVIYGLRFWRRQAS